MRKESKYYAQIKIETAIIHTDSAVSLDMIANHLNHNYTTEEWRKTLRRLREENGWSIRIDLVKAHAGYEGNETADGKAKEAASDDSSVDFSQVPLTYIMKMAKESSITAWDFAWKNPEEGLLTRQFFPNIGHRLVIYSTLSKRRWCYRVTERVERI